jgi:hypothetical protein
MILPGTTKPVLSHDRIWGSFLLHGLMQLREFSTSNLGILAQPVGTSLGAVQRSTDGAVEPTHELGHLLGHPILGGLARGLGLEPVAPDLLASNLERLACTPRQRIERTSRSSSCQRHRGHEAGHQTHLVGVADGGLLRRGVRYRHRRAGQLLLDCPVNREFVDERHAVFAKKLCEVVQRRVVGCPVRLGQAAQIARRGIVPELVLGLSPGHVAGRLEQHRADERSQVWRTPSRVLELLVPSTTTADRSHR